MTVQPSDTIFFDAYDTIVTFTKTPDTNNAGIYADLFKHGHVDAKSNDGKFRRNYIMTKNEPREKMCEYLCNYKTNIAYDIIRDMTEKLHDELASMRFYPDTIPALRALAARGYTLGIISNLAQPYGIRLRQKVQEELGDILSQENVTFSYEEDLVKPQKEIFDRAMHKAHRDPSSCIMVWNHRINDTWAAINAWMQAILIDRDNSSPSIPHMEKIITLTELLEKLP
jgi:FMN phosphatase YigB (HAD superfamily)